MKKIIHFALVITGLFSISSISAAEQQPLDKLLRQVQQGYEQEVSLDQARIKAFKQRDEQQKIELEQANNELDKAQQESDLLQQIITENSDRTAKLIKLLNEEKADLNQLFKALNSAAIELEQQTKSSMVSAQFPKQKQAISPLLTANYQSSDIDINNLWSYYLLHMVETGKISTFPTKLVYPNGTISQDDITRLGPFTAFNQQGYMRYLANSNAFILLPKQPQGTEQSNLNNYYTQTAKMKTLTLDPSKGPLIAIAADKSDNFQKIQQAGIVGALILVVGLIALFIVIHRGIYLFKTNKKVQQQRNNLDQIGDNPLGRILTIGTQQSLTSEQKNHLLDEAILTEIPTLRKGLSTLAVLAGVAPLLGLLGTVAGMIETFQAITEFGNANPKILSSGISQALLTTEFGLMVAVPLALAHSYLTNKCTSLIHILEHQGAGLVALSNLEAANKVGTCDVAA